MGMTSNIHYVIFELCAEPRNVMERNPRLSRSMENGAMSSTPSVSPLPSSDQESSKQSLETGPVLELNESSQAGLPERSTWVSRALAKFSTQHPRACGLCKKFALYIRGPRPKVDLPRT